MAYGLREINSIETHHFRTKVWNSKLNPSVGKLGGLFSKMHVSTSNSLLHPLYGSVLVANSTNVMPSDHTSARISYSFFFGSIRSGWLKEIKEKKKKIDYVVG